LICDRAASMAVHVVTSLSDLVGAVNIQIDQPRVGLRAKLEDFPAGFL
jgi:hypothetical protein